MFQKQPVKFAAMEIVWKTDTHVPEYVFGRLHSDGSVSGGIRIPQLDSILAGFSPDTKVTGLTSVPAENRPTAAEATLVHFCFDVMAMIGSVLILLASGTRGSGGATGTCPTTVGSCAAPRSPAWPAW